MPARTEGATPRVVEEVGVLGSVPRFEVPSWRERYGVVAGITGRGKADGGGFNLGLWSEAPVSEIMTRWRALRLAEPHFSGVVLGSQIHRAQVAWHDRVSGWLQSEGIDGHATSAPGVMLAVTVADCIPVYLCAPSRGAVALLHAGWRGTAAEILRHGLELLERRASVLARDLVMHCGVGICGSCYEVGSEVVAGCGRRADGPGPWHLDLREVLADQAGRLGIADVTVSGWCSAHHRDRFFSHRASGGRDGRMVAYLGRPE